MSDTVLVTGGAGFIGCHLARRLLQRGNHVLAFDNLHPQVHTKRGRPVDLEPDVELLPGDVTLAGNWETLLKLHRPRFVVHLAAETGTGQSLTEATRHASVNGVGTSQMLDAFTRAGHVPEHIVLTSSRAIYGDGAWRDGRGRTFYPDGRSRSQLEQRQWDFSSPEGEPSQSLPSAAGKTFPNPVNIYAATKLAQEHMLSAWARARGAHLTVLRLQNVYGPGQAPGNPYTGVLTLFARLAQQKQVLDVYEDGHIIRDFVYVEDVAAAIVGALQKPTEAVRTFDIGSGVPTTILEVAREIARRSGAPEPHVTGKFRDGDVRAASCEIDRAQLVLGYSPLYDLQRGLGELVDAFRAE